MKYPFIPDLTVQKRDHGDGDITYRKAADDIGRIMNSESHSRQSHEQRRNDSQDGQYPDLPEHPERREHDGRIGRMTAGKRVALGCHIHYGLIRFGSTKALDIIVDHVWSLSFSPIFLPFSLSIHQ